MHCFFDFTKGKFIKKSGIITGYVVNEVGMIALPITTYLVSSHGWIAFVLYLPQDRFDMKVSLSPEISANPGKNANRVVTAGALLSRKAGRLKRVSDRLEDEIYQRLIKIDKQVRRAK